MKYCAVALFLIGSAQADTLSGTAEVSNTQEDQEVLSIKMPEAVAVAASQKVAPKVASLSLVETSSEVGMIESGVLSATLKPLVKAKVNKVMSFINTMKGEYEHGTEDQKKAVQSKAESLIMMGSSARGYNMALCDELWASMSELAGKLSFYFCPSLVFPAADAGSIPPLEVVMSGDPSRLRSAFLTSYFWSAAIGYNSFGVITMLAPTVCYYWGKDGNTCGRTKVMQKLPYIGWPSSTKLSDPVYWHCDSTTCIAPIKAWSDHQNYCLASFGPAGLVVEAIVPLVLWR
jgi:hypothetical protein